MDCALGVHLPKRNVGHRQEFLAHLEIPRVAHQSHHLQAYTWALISGSLEPPPHWILTLEESPRESFADDGRPWNRVAGTEVPAIHEGNLHRSNETGRDIQKIRHVLAGRAAINGHSVVRAITAEQRTAGQRDRLHTRHRPQVFDHLVPIRLRLRAFGDRIESKQPFRGEPWRGLRQPFESGP